jgi:SAM-dependent methyltransferase
MHGRNPLRRVLNTGSGPSVPNKLHPAFDRMYWDEVRLDIDPGVNPDVLANIKNMRDKIPDGSFDAIWSSHNIEHLHFHEVIPALRDFRRILKPQGFVLLTCPDLEAVCQLLLEQGPHADIYMSPAGPIKVADMLFGHAASIAVGNTFMCHNSGFTAQSLANAAIEAGFLEVRMGKGRMYDLWALMSLPQTDLDAVKSWLVNTPERVLMA